ncbi:hypothetical protein J5N97_003315 [Dioscorea zingiberensis]|uniref:Uncharacterized protein n=1 Tax=Dioscorea zingiberensis TaxID=325984 RepID=A0A9D5D5B7_9LILI|nr:hypothetical protein J5N97_003315 [Dioscorea zingiberensis]
MFVLEAELPVWVICYIPVFMSFLNILPAPGSFPFIVPYLLFENAMSVTKFNAMMSDVSEIELFELNKLMEEKPEANPPAKKANKIYKEELTLAVLTAAARSLLSAQGIHFYFLLFQGVSFLLTGLGLLGEQMS